MPECPFGFLRKSILRRSQDTASSVSLRSLRFHESGAGRFVEGWPKVSPLLPTHTASVLQRPHTKLTSESVQRTENPPRTKQRRRARWCTILCDRCDLWLGAEVRRALQRSIRLGRSRRRAVRLHSNEVTWCRV